MSLWRRLFGRKKPPEQTGYGLCPENPILCGGGPAGERDYLERLRCPSGAAVRYARHSSTSTTSVGFLAKPGVYFDAGPSVSRRREAAHSQEVALDVNLVECECGKHRVEVFMDMYHKGPAAPIAESGWALQPAVVPDTPPPPLPACPYCGKPLRTERAKQCLHCGMDWHDPNNVACRRT